MNNEIEKVEGIEDTKNDGANGTVDLSKMTREEVEAYAIKQSEAYANQKIRAEKAEAKPKVEVPTTPEPKEPTPVVDPADTATPKPSLDEQYEISQLSSKFSLEEIKEAKSLTGTSFGNTTSEVTENPGFLAHINAKRELNKSDSMINDNPIHIDTYQSKQAFKQEVESGNIDLTTNPEARAKYVDMMAQEMSDKNFTL